MEGTQGIFGQMVEATKNSTPSGCLTLSDIQAAADKMLEAEMNARRAKQKGIEQNIAHLNRRAKELGKDVPMELMMRASFEYPLMIGSDYYNRHREWLT